MKDRMVTISPDFVDFIDGIGSPAAIKPSKACVDENGPLAYKPRRLSAMARQDRAVASADPVWSE